MSAHPDHIFLHLSFSLRHHLGPWHASLRAVYLSKATNLGASSSSRDPAMIVAYDGGAWFLGAVLGP